MYVAEDYALDVFLCSHCLCDPRGKLFSGNFQQEMSSAEWFGYLALSAEIEQTTHSRSSVT